MAQSKRILPPWCKDVKKAMIDKDLNVTQLSEMAGISRVYASGIINGRTVAPELAEKIGKTIGVPYYETVI